MLPLACGIKMETLYLESNNTFLVHRLIWFEKVLNVQQNVVAG